MRLSASLLVAGMVISVCIPIPACAQLIVDGRPTCVRCRVELQPIVTLESPDERTDLGGTFGNIVPAVARDSSGRYFVSANRGTQIAVFDRSGRRISVLGRAGDGPGEYRGIISILVSGGDTIVVRDMARITVYTPSLTIARSMSVRPTVHPVAALEGGMLLMKHAPPGRSGAHFLASALGDSIGAIGPASDSLRPTCRLQCGRISASVGSGRRSIWTYTAGSYTLTEWNTRGDKVQTFAIRSSPWFVPWDRDPEGHDLTTRPNAIIAGVGFDSSRRMWILGSAPATDWKPFTGERTGTRVIRGVSVTNVDSLSAGETNHLRTARSAIVDVVDIAGGKVLASTRLSGSPILLLGGTLVYSVTQSADGLVSVRVARMVLVEG